MVRIAPVRLQYSQKTLWFDALDFCLEPHDEVVVSTARGLEFGYLSNEVFEAGEDDLIKLKTELKPVVRRADYKDKAQAKEMQERSTLALPIFKEMAQETSEDMRPVSVEFLLDGEKAIFYFESEGRIDFRELVRRLAAEFHVRVDMRQIGVRDEARIVGGLGHCGQELCCCRLGGEFCPVSIRMAKEQDLSLNPQKISGVCGRLMCCLRYEYDAYKDFKGRAPKINSKVETPEGPAKVVDLDVPREMVTIQVEGEKRVKIPLAEMDTPRKGERPSRVSAQVYERFAKQETFGTLASVGELRLGKTSIFSDSKTPSKQTGETEVLSTEQPEKKGTKRKPRRRTKMTESGQKKTEQLATGAKEKQTGSNRQKTKQRPKASVATKKEEATGSKPSKKNNRNKNNNKNKQQSRTTTNKTSSPQKKNQKPKGSPRPGQRSSGLRAEPERSGSTSQQVSQHDNSRKNEGSQASSGRKPRRRSHKAGTDRGNEES